MDEVRESHSASERLCSSYAANQRSSPQVNDSMAELSAEVERRVEKMREMIQKKHALAQVSLHFSIISHTFGGKLLKTENELLLRSQSEWLFWRTR